MRGLRHGFTALLGAALLAHTLHTFAGLGGAGSEKLFSEWVYLGVMAGAAVLCLWRARERRLLEMQKPHDPQQLSGERHHQVAAHE